MVADPHAKGNAVTTLLDADEARRLLAELTPAAEHTVLARALRTVVAVQVALDHAVAKAQQLARILANEVTAQDAVELLSAVLVRDAASAPNMAAEIMLPWRSASAFMSKMISVLAAIPMAPITAPWSAMPLPGAIFSPIAKVR